jgi:hypothetical protein
MSIGMMVYRLRYDLAELLAIGAKPEVMSEGIVRACQASVESS